MGLKFAAESPDGLVKDSGLYLRISETQEFAFVASFQVILTLLGITLRLESFQFRGKIITFAYILCRALWVRSRKMNYRLDKTCLSGMVFEGGRECQREEQLFLLLFFCS